MTKPINPDYHWTPAAMRTFLEALAETGLVVEACDAVGKSRRAAYNARFRTEGRAFAIGWEAALLVARATLADTLMERAIAGYQVKTVRDPETHTSVSDRYDNKGGQQLLNRLDRMSGVYAAPEPGSDAALARIVAQDFWRFLDLVEKGGQGSEAALFLAARTPAEPAQGCELADEDVDSAEEYVTVDAVVAALDVWFSDCHDEMVTNFPPPADFEGWEDGEFGDFSKYGYCRALTDTEAQAQTAIEARTLAPFRAAAEIARDAWLASARQAANDAGEAEVAA